MSTQPSITVNGEPAPRPGTVVELLRQRLGDRRPHGIAVAVNDIVVPRADWPVHRLFDGDRVEIVTAVQGG